MNASPVTIAPTSRWPHRLALLLACATFPLIWIGGLVTTYDAGMAVPDWPTSFGYNPFSYPLSTWFHGPWNIFIEHGHRLFASLVGMLAIAMVVTFSRGESRIWARRLAWLALAAVIFQGVLGGMRVLMDERLLAKIHGCFGPMFFGLTAVLAVVTSRRWQSSPPPRLDGTANRLHIVAIGTTILAYLQIVLGAQLRHVTGSVEPSVFRAFVLMHLIVASLLVVHAIVLLVVVLRGYCDQRALWMPAAAVALLVLVQVGLGIGTWILKYGMPAWLGESSYLIVERSDMQAIITTAHVAIGSLIFVCSTVTTLWSLRLFRSTKGGVVAPGVGRWSAA